MIIKFQSKGYTNTEIMKYWLTNIISPCVERKWWIENRRTGYTGKAKLILGRLSVHASAINSFNLIKLTKIKKRVKYKLTYQSGQIRSIIKEIQQASTSEKYEKWHALIHYNICYEGLVLLMFDMYAAHSSDFFIDECTFNDIIPYQEPASSSDQVQVLDIGIFCVQKT